MAAEDAKRSAQELAELTGGAVTSVNQVQRLIVWLSSVLPADGRVILVERIEEQDENGEITKPEKTALTRKHVERLLAYLESLGPLPAPLVAAQRALQIRLYGGSKTPTKFNRMASMHVGGVLRSTYVFNGASQTGRFSSKSPQLHNLARDYLPYELDALDALLAGEPYNKFAIVGDDAPVSRKLSLLIRPALVAQPGNAFVWGDWANIEARVAPWLANDPGADKILDIYRAVDDGTEKYDVYTRVAAEISGVTLEAVDKDIRQRGKVTSLACQFGGGANALINMAAAYRMHLGEDEAKAAVAGWREANPWAPRFWKSLWEAITGAIDTPGVAFEAGLVTYIFLEGYLGGSLLCRLPSGRFLTYRRIRWEMVEERDEDTNEVIDVRRELMFSRDMGRVKLWPGLACENIVQATAACILRGTLVRLDAAAFDWMPVRLHTHDEVLVECGEAFTVNATEQLLREMERGFTWTVGLPIKADVTVGRFYSKNKESWGL
jgi:DNA polymerase